MDSPGAGLHHPLIPHPKPLCSFNNSSLPIMSKFSNPATVMAFLLLLFNVPLFVSAECTCDSGEDEGIDKKAALRLKLIAFFAILVASIIAVLLPILGKKVKVFRPENPIFFLIKAFAAGVILATGFIHVLPDAFETLTSPCLGEDSWGKFPFTGFVAMVSAMATLVIDSLASSYFNRLSLHKAKPVDEELNGGGLVHGHALAHAHGSLTMEQASGSSEQLRHRVIAQVLEIGILIHSVIIGISMGASQSPSTIKPLVAALTFHQFFEGLGLGGCITMAQFKSITNAIMALFFALTTPIGIVIGILISRSYDENSPKALVVEGLFNAASAGILIYMALVDLLASDFMNPKLQSNLKLLLGSYVSLLLGSGCMSLLAKWA